MVLSATSVALCVIALLGFAGLGVWHRRSPLPARVRAGLLAALAVLAFVFHLGLPREDPALRWSAPQPHPNEYLLYYLGTKYFTEVGYTGLYAAAVLADWEDDRENFRPDAAMRDLSSYRLVPRQRAVSDAERIRAPFGPERWAAFKRELAVLRATAPPAFWHETGYFVDHGYNGTPLITAVSGTLAHQPLLDTAAFIDLARFLDLYLLILLAVGIAALEGAVAGLTFAFFLFVNPLNDGAFVSGAFLRFDYLVALALALLSLRRGWLAASGALFAVSGLLRIFPLVFPGLLFLCDLAPRDRVARLRRRAKLHLSFALTALVLLGVTSIREGPEGRNPWLEFTGNILMHAETFGGNQIGLQVPLRYTPAMDVRGGEDGLRAPPEWRAELSRTLAARRVPLVLLATAAIVFALWSVRRGEEGAVFLAGLLVVFAIVPLAHYYYAVMGLLPLVCPQDRRREAWLVAAFLALAVSATPGLLPGSQDLLFAVASGVVGIFLLAVQGAAPGRKGRASAATVALAACAVLGCQEGDRPFVPIEGETAVSRAMGFAVTRPSDWVFLPVSGLVRDRPERVVGVEEIWNLFDIDVELTPILQTAPRVDPRPGIDPLVRVIALPLKPGQSKRAEAFILGPPVTELILRKRDIRRRAHPDLQVVADSEAFEFAGLPGARMRFAYTVEGPDGEARPVEERLYYGLQGKTIWWVEMVAPAPMSPEIERRFDRILSSMRIAP